jgi:hypothetical protein
MDQRSELLAEMMLHAAQFCNQVETFATLLDNKRDLEEFRLKLGQARNMLERLQQTYNEGALEIQTKGVMAEFRQLIIALLWISYYTRQHLDFRLFRRLVSIEAAFTYLLLNDR